MTAAQKAGLKYEVRALDHLRSTLGAHLQASRVIRFYDKSGIRKCVPDAFIRPGPWGNGRAFVFEIKIRHMPEVWWQLRRLYYPVLKALPYVTSVHCVEVVRSYDPAEGFAETLERISDIWSFVLNPTFDGRDATGVYVWRG